MSRSNTLAYYIRQQKSLEIGGSEHNYATQFVSRLQLVNFLQRVVNFLAKLVRFVHICNSFVNY